MIQFDLRISFKGFEASNGPERFPKLTTQQYPQMVSEHHPFAIQVTDHTFE